MAVNGLVFAANDLGESLNYHFTVHYWVPGSNARIFSDKFGRKPIVIFLGNYKSFHGQIYSILKYKSYPSNNWLAGRLLLSLQFY